MIELMTAIAAWCANLHPDDRKLCQDRILACVVEGSKPGDEKEYYNLKLKKCVLRKEQK